MESIIQRDWSENIVIQLLIKSVIIILKKEVTRFRYDNDGKLNH